jgi:hypothetical protein
MKKQIYKSKIEPIFMIIGGMLIILAVPVKIFINKTDDIIIHSIISIGYVISTVFYWKQINNKKTIFLPRFSKRYKDFFSNDGVFRYSNEGFYFENIYISWAEINRIKIVAINPQSKFYQYLKINLFTVSANYSFNILTPGIYKLYLSISEKFPELSFNISIGIIGNTKHIFEYIRK